MDRIFTVHLSEKELIYLVSTIKRDIQYCKFDKQHITSSEEDDKLNERINIGQNLLTSWVSNEEYDI